MQFYEYTGMTFGKDMDPPGHVSGWVKVFACACKSNWVFDLAAIQCTMGARTAVAMGDT